MSWFFRNDYRVLLVTIAVSAAIGGCATSSATRTLLRESEPVVGKHEQIRRELVDRAQTGGGLAPKGGCPVCQW